MSKYCPTWIIDCIIAEASIDFIELEVGLEFVSKNILRVLEIFMKM